MLKRTIQYIIIHEYALRHMQPINTTKVLDTEAKAAEQYKLDMGQVIEN